MGSQAFWDNLWGTVWNPVRWVQALLILLTIPLWMPIVRALWRELQEVLAPLGGVYGNRTPRPIRDRLPGASIKETLSPDGTRFTIDLTMFIEQEPEPEVES